MTVIPLLRDRRGFSSKVLQDLLASGWTLERVPTDGRIPNNGLNLILRGGDRDLRVRIFIYKVTSSSRNRPHERRIEITTTYQGGLRRTAGFSDIVLGIDTSSDKYVGVDPRRLQMGGATHNASSFFDLEGLAVKPTEMRLNPRPAASTLFSNGIETHAFFDGTRLAEYLFNTVEIHSGLYGYAGPFSGTHRSKTVSLPRMVSAETARGNSFVFSSRQRSRRPPMSLTLINAYEEGDLSKARRKVSPQELRQMLALWNEIGALGEQAVLTSERNRLRNLGLTRQASKVERVSLTSVGEGYDISSYENNGVTKRYLEVKSTTGSNLIVDMSRGEWKAAKKYGRRYYLVRVTKVKTKPELRFFRDPAGLELRGVVTRVPTGWRVDLRSAPIET